MSTELTEISSEDAAILTTISTLKAQLFECNLRLATVTKDKRKVEKKNEELSLHIQKQRQVLAEEEVKLKEGQRKLEQDTLERRKQEEKNFELENELKDAKKSLKDMQQLLQSIHTATDQLKKKQSSRDVELDKATHENKRLKNKIVELEWKIRDSELALQGATANKEDTIRKMQEQLSESHDMLIRAKEEVVKLRGEKAMKENELEHCKLENQARIDNLHQEFDRKIDRYMEQALRSPLQARKLV